MLLHYDIDEPKPIEQMTDAELKDYIQVVIRVEDNLRRYSMDICALMIRRENAEHDRLRANGTIARHNPVSRRPAAQKPELTVAERLKQMQLTPEEEFEEMRRGR